MANKERNKRSARKARAEERVQKAEAQVAAGAAPNVEVALAKAEAAKDNKPAAPKKVGFFGRIKNYLLDVRTELRRVTWPSRQDVIRWSGVVIVALVFFSVYVFVLDNAIVTPILYAISGLGA